MALQQQGYVVQIYTAHHDVTHCFEETRGEGALARCIHVVGDIWLPRTICGKMYAACANLRMLVLALVVSVTCLTSDVFIVDQVSIPNPVLRLLTAKPVLFYCHFPDKLLCTERGSGPGSWWKKIYRVVVDQLEERTTGFASRILGTSCGLLMYFEHLGKNELHPPIVNSEFTASIFYQAFPSLAQVDIQVLYPPVNVDSIRAPKLGQEAENHDRILFLSLNRFERKKNLALAIHALAHLKTLVQELFPRVHLILAGGYDVDNLENVSHLAELEQILKHTDLTSHVSMLCSISHERKLELLFKAQAVVYTPDREHFGIVPVEAMCAGTPVIAVASGGPTESIVDSKTGYLCPDNPQAFAQAMAKILTMTPSARVAMGQAGQSRVQELFSLTAFQRSLHQHVSDLLMVKKMS